MNKLIVLLFALVIMFPQAQNKKWTKEIKKFQKELNAEYKNTKESPLRGDNFTNFKQHPFFPIDLNYRVNAHFVKTENAEPFELPTSSGKTKTYKEYGKIEFKLKGETFKLSLYQSMSLLDDPKYKDYLFLPFKDATNGKETYGGGKYLDLKIPTSNTMVIDFNQSYQPYCAYNAFDYNCPLVPEENKLPVEIRAGVMYEDVYHH